MLTTGSGRLFSTLDHYLVLSQMSSFATAFVTVFGVIFLVFRSFRFGLLTIVANLLPVLAVLGVMGYLDISMNIATVMVASVALGVVDDDTIHFINRYRREVAAGRDDRRSDRDGDRARRARVADDGDHQQLRLRRAVLLSEYKPTAWFGGLLALTMAVAFLAEVFILPATIKLLPRCSGAERAIAECAPPAAMLGLPWLVRHCGRRLGASRPAVRQRVADGRLRAQSQRHARTCGAAVRRGEDRVLDAVAAR